MKKIYTKEDFERAINVDLAEFLQRRGIPLKRAGREWILGRDSGKINIRGNLWYSHYEQIGGNTVQFLQSYYNISSDEAVEMLIGPGLEAVYRSKAPTKNPREQTAFSLPPRHSDLRRVFAYLLQTRLLDRDVVTSFVHANLIYEDAEHHNAVFVGSDDKGIPRHAHKRATTGTFKANETGSNPNYSFHWIGTGGALYVFESPVDMLAYITLHKDGWEQHSYVALCGIAEHAAVQTLISNPHLDTVVVCTDHDPMGIEGFYRIQEAVSVLGEYEIGWEQPENKDWDEDLKARHGLTPLPSREHPKLELMRQLCEELPLLFSGQKCPARPLNSLTFKCSQLTLENMETLEKQSLEIAGTAFLFAQKRLRQIGMQPSNEWYAKRLLGQYQPHKDKGGLRSHLDTIIGDIKTLRSNYSPCRVYTESELRRQIDSLLELVLDCNKLQASLYLEQTEQQEILAAVMTV